MAFNYFMTEKNGIFSINENATDQVIKTFTDMKDAKSFLRHLNLGGGFDGWTPTFLLKKFDVVYESD